LPQNIVTTVVPFDTKLPYKFFALVIPKYECLIVNLCRRQELPVGRGKVGTHFTAVFQMGIVVEMLVE